MKPHLPCLFILSMALVGCGSSHHGDDIDRFIKDSENIPRGKVEPLPEVRQYIPYIFNAAGDLPDPFQPRKATSSRGDNQSKLQPDLKRPREALENFPLENLKYVGTLNKGRQIVALINAPDGQVYQVTVGNYVGQNYGIITKITPDELLVKEVVQDLVGDWTERQVPIYPQE
jgi:type IV pilus assembly protein PilP